VLGTPAALYNTAFGTQYFSTVVSRNIFFNGQLIDEVLGMNKMLMHIIN
jgi:hypothetical protein